MQRIKFTGTIEVPSFSTEKQTCGILIQLLNEVLGILAKEKKASELGYFIRERLDARERRMAFSILNQIHKQVGQRLDTIKGHRNLGEDLRGSGENFQPIGSLDSFFKAQQLLHSLDQRFGRRHSTSSEERKGRAVRIIRRLNHSGTLDDSTGGGGI